MLILIKILNIKYFDNTYAKSILYISKLSIFEIHLKASCIILNIIVNT
jgi:hypothetical protein